jgi:predicted enzyme related to lactoylglutathione lyase
MRDGKIDYVELPGGNLAETKNFYAKAFGWEFTDYGSSYAAFDEGLDGGLDADTTATKPLVILFADDLEAALVKVTGNGGKITVPIFEFPGGRRFHFQDPAGNEMAVWTET